MALDALIASQQAEAAAAATEGEGQSAAREGSFTGLTPTSPLVARPVAICGARRSAKHKGTPTPMAAEAQRQRKQRAQQEGRKEEVRASCEAGGGDRGAGGGRRGGRRFREEVCVWGGGVRFQYNVPAIVTSLPHLISNPSISHTDQCPVPHAVLPSPTPPSPPRAPRPW